jgi:hypothetical protein
MLQSRIDKIHMETMITIRQKPFLGHTEVLDRSHDAQFANVNM